MSVVDVGQRPAQTVGLTDGRRQTKTVAEANSRVVHWVGRVTHEVFSFLGPATAALAESGVAQTVVVFDDAQCRRLLSRFHGSIDIALVPMSSNPMRDWARSLDRVHQLSKQGSVKAIHLHGFLPSLARALLSGVDADLYYSPHASKSLNSMRALGSVLRLAMRPMRGWPRQRMIANLAVDARTLTEITHQSVKLIESPVADVFFEEARDEAVRPIVMTGGRMPNSRSADVFAQLAVLLCDQSLGLEFNWLGNPDEASMRCLQAANVEVTDAQDDADRAVRLARGWLYVEVCETRGFSVSLVEAMAAGLPCLAIDTPYHRDLIRHGETGYLYRSHEEALVQIAGLVDSPELRSQIGDAARQEARDRFSGEQFRNSLFSAYDLPLRNSESRV